MLNIYCFEIVFNYIINYFILTAHLRAVACTTKRHRWIQLIWCNANMLEINIDKCSQNMSYFTRRKNIIISYNDL